MGAVLRLAGILLSGLAVIAAWPTLGRRFLEKYPIGWKLSDWTLNDSIVLLAIIAFAAALVLVLYPDERRSAANKLQFTGLTAVLLVANLLVVWAAVVMMGFAREYFGWSISELGHIALAQEVLIFLAIILLAASTIAFRNRDDSMLFGLRRWHVTLLMAFAILILLMEEMSWGQHIFGWNTPEVFAGNIQDETNFHNFFTNKFEFLYYSIALACFVAAPILFDRFELKPLDDIRYFVPGLPFAVASLPLAGQMYESWGIAVFQFYHVAALLLALHFARSSTGTARVLCAMIAVTMAASQFLFLKYGHLLVRSFELSETRELTISITLFAYTIWLYRKARSASAETAAAGRPIAIGR